MEEKYKIHAFYIVGILLTVIIVLVSVQWSGIPNLSEKLSFALTLASLILAILAIGYAVYSNVSISRNVSTLNDVSLSVTSSAKDISEAARDLSNKIEGIPTKLEIMEGKVDQTNILLKQYSEKQEVPSKSEEQQPTENRNSTDDSFLKRSSITGLETLYACSLAYTTKIPFTIESLCESTNIGAIDYVKGFMVAAFASETIDSVSSKEIYNIIDISKDVLEGVKAELVERVKNDTAEFRELINKDIVAIEKFFEA
jgi:hypothetical protein